MLTKQPTVTFVPGVAGQAASPAYTWCTPRETSGAWEYTCYNMDVPESGGFAIPPGGVLVTVVNEDDEVVDVYIRVCVSEWVPDGGVITEPVCTFVPAKPFIQTVAPRLDVTPNYGWNAGANSIDELDDDVKLSFTMDGAVGVVVGLTNTRGDVTDYTRMTHALYFHMTPTGQLLFDVMEEGLVVGSSTPYVRGDAFEIRRAGGQVTYWYDGSVVRTSRKTSSGVVLVGSTLYASGDQI